MPIEKDLTIIQLKKPDSCFVCDQLIVAGMHVPQVETTVVIKIRRKAHPECAIELGKRFIYLGQKAAELNRGEV